jgi:ABC-type dipeptide/oligopeptide/nickel transport system permease subunit
MQPLQPMNTTPRPEEAVLTLDPTGTRGAFAGEERVSVSPLQAAFRRFLRDKRAVASIIVVGAIVLFTFLFPLVYIHLGPTIPSAQPGAPALVPAQYHDPIYVPNDVATDAPGTVFPLGALSLVHPLGTDDLGRDVLARLMSGVQVSFELALAVELLDIALGVLFGALAGWFGGWLGTFLDRFTDIAFAFPQLLLIILLGASLGPVFDDHLPHGISRLVMLTLALGVLAWPLMMRQVRGQTLQLKQLQYVEAARAAGTSNRSIILRHIVPNVMNIVVVTATLDILTTIIGEAGISLLGFGIQTPNSSLGLMIGDGITQMYSQYSLLLWPVLVLVTIVVALSFIGDGARDAFDPRTKD